jgi:hypothetical protein
MGFKVKASPLSLRLNKLKPIIGFAGYTVMTVMNDHLSRDNFGKVCD